LDLRVRKITRKMKIAAARGIAETLENPTHGRIVPDTFDRTVVQNIKKRVEEAVNEGASSQD
jgi:malic enzyme